MNELLYSCDVEDILLGAQIILSTPQQLEGNWHVGTLNNGEDEHFYQYLDKFDYSALGEYWVITKRIGEYSYMFWTDRRYKVFIKSSMSIEALYNWGFYHITTKKTVLNL